MFEHTLYSSNIELVEMKILIKHNTFITGQKARVYERGASAE
jgi:hypothetical protein